MAKVRKTKRRKLRFPDKPQFHSLRPYIAEIAKGVLGKHKLFSLCVKASISKCFEFNLAVRSGAQFESAFFAISALRGICEDLIVLRYIKQMPSVDREALIAALIDHETATRIKLQGDFFSAVRPQQLVLRTRNVDAQIATSEAAAQAIWRHHGWPNFNRGAVPPIRQIAEKQGATHLLILYDYLYRLTSAGVHFNVQSLLRSGWGEKLPSVTFSTKHFRGYFSAYCAVYGAFMFCLYFEFFGSVLRPTRKATMATAKIREAVLFTPRWPEMVTFEEMNLKYPERGRIILMVLSAIQATARKRLLPRKLLHSNSRSAEVQLARLAFKALASGPGSHKSS